MDTTNETPAVTSPEGTTEEQSQVQVSPEQQQQLNEKKAFERHVSENGEAIPENFKDAGSWFDSLKNAQSEYTKSRQEVSELKKQYEENGAINPNYKEPEQATEETTTTEEPLDLDSLKIPDPAPEEPPQTQETSGVPAISVEDWNQWGTEIDSSGELSSDTRENIRATYKVDDGIIDQIIGGRNAMLKEAVNTASEVVGSKENLDSMMKWASTNLPEAERDQINAGLRGPAWKTVIRGLESQYNQSVKAQKNQEPTLTSGNAVPQGSTMSTLEPFSSREEMFVAMRDPKYKYDAKYRASVEQRVTVTQETYGGL